MPRLTKGRSRKSGLPPGTLVHIGAKRAEGMKISLISYDGAELEERECQDVGQCLACRGKRAVTWINVEGIDRTEVLEKFGDAFGIHPLVLEDILNTEQRPKIEDYGSYYYMVLKMLHAAAPGEGIVTEQVSIVFGSNFVISFQEGIHGDAFNAVRERIRNDKSRIRKSGVDFLVYSLIDAIVDNYFVVLEKMGEAIESVENEVVANPTPRTLEILHRMKREVLFLRRSVWPLREVIVGMERDEDLFQASTRVYLKDVYDHTIQVIDTIEIYRDILSGTLDIYLSSISNKLNTVMKVLTVIATIFMPLTFIAGVYGMNFKHMPELEWIYGYPLILSVMITVAVVMLVYFRKKKWI